MKILHISTSDIGGAGLASIRFHEALLNKQIQSSILFLDCKKYNGPSSFVFNKKKKQNLEVQVIPSLTLKNYFSEKLFKTFSKQNAEISNKKKESQIFEQQLAKDSQLKFEVFSSPYTEYDLLESELYQSSDIIHLHWVSGFLDFETFFKYNTKPIFWSLHDEYLLLGAFHYKLDCDRNMLDYGAIDRAYASVKQHALLRSKAPITFVCGADWLMEALKKHVFSTINRKKIYYPVDKYIYRYIDKHTAKRMLNLPTDKKTLLFVAGNVMNYRKGFDLLLPILNDSDFMNVHFLVMGDLNIDLNIKNATFLGKITDELLMPIIYASADFYLLPSRAEGFSYGMSEALCCGTPVIAFDVADHRSFLEPNHLGLVATSIDSVSLKQALLQCISGEISFNHQQIAARVIEFLDSEKVAENLIALYLDESKNNRK